MVRLRLTHVVGDLFIETAGTPRPNFLFSARERYGVMRNMIVTARVPKTKRINQVGSSKKRLIIETLLRTQLERPNRQSFRQRFRGAWSFSGFWLLEFEYLLQPSV